MDFMGFMVVLWLAALVVFIIGEALTTALTSIWFAAGALAALIVAAIAPELIWLQVLFFVVVSGLALLFTRPLAKRYFNAKSMRATNADRVLEMTGVVKVEIDNLKGTGLVYVGGKDWTARSTDGQIIPKDALVQIRRIEGVKLMVEPQLVSTEKAD